jgi:hypothetical protein
MLRFNTTRTAERRYRLSSAVRLSQPAAFTRLNLAPPGAWRLARACSRLQNRRQLQPKEPSGFAENLSGLIERVTFFNEETGLTVLTRDAIAQFLQPRPDWRLTRFSLDGQAAAQPPPAGWCSAKAPRQHLRDTPELSIMPNTFRLTHHHSLPACPREKVWAKTSSSSRA